MLMRTQITKLTMRPKKPLKRAPEEQNYESIFTQA